VIRGELDDAIAEIAENNQVINEQINGMKNEEISSSDIARYLTLSPLSTVRVPSTKRICQLNNQLLLTTTASIDNMWQCYNILFLRI
jgi:demethoxyubiquinone hydroxylase (CLK1/Coq7/Cat5 family)